MALFASEQQHAIENAVCNVPEGRTEEEEADEGEEEAKGEDRVDRSKLERGSEGAREGRKREEEGGRDTAHSTTCYQYRAWQSV
eukprot:2335784-Rhodomonas_salina.2